MAESTLSLANSDFRDAVAYFLFGKDYSATTATQQGRIDDVIASGYRQFLYPPAIDGIPIGYEWTFLRPTYTITTTAGDPAQDLPDDFGRLINGFTFAADAQVPSVLADVGEARIRALRQRYDETGRPRVAAIAIKAATGTVGQRREVQWYPTPDDAYSLTFRYESMINNMAASSSYPAGAMKHAETIRLSCLAVADSMVNDSSGEHWQKFVMALASSIARDKREGTKFFGNVGTKDEYSDTAFGDYRNYTLTVSGNDIET